MSVRTRARAGALAGTAGLVGALLASAVIVGPGGVARAAGSSDLAVTSPAGPVTALPGRTATAKLEVGNLGDSPLRVRIQPEQVRLLDNGSTRLLGHPDPMFAGRVQVQPAAATIPARHEIPVTVRVRMPKLAPNDYFLGFLVSPVIHGPSITVVNAVGALVVLNVPGPRDRHLTASFVGLPAFAFASSASGFVRAFSTGKASLEFTTDTQLSGFPKQRPSVVTELPQLLPPGLDREEPVHIHTWLGLGWVTVHTTLVYDLTNQRTGEVALSRTVVLVDPLWLLVPGVLLLLAVGFVARRRRRRRRAMAALLSPRSGRDRVPA